MPTPFPQTDFLHDMQKVMRTCLTGRIYHDDNHHGDSRPIEGLCDNCIELYAELLDKQIAYLIELRNNVK